MMAAFHVYKMDEDALAADYEFFNSSYDNILAVFREVTGEQFVAGNLPSLESVKKSLQNSNKSIGVTEVDSEPPKAESSTTQVSEFLRKLDLADLIPIFAEEGITMLDMADLTNSDLKNFGVDQFRQRKVLLRAVEDLNQHPGAAKTVHKETSGAERMKSVQVKIKEDFILKKQRPPAASEEKMKVTTTLGKGLLYSPFLDIYLHFFYPFH